LRWNYAQTQCDWAWIRLFTRHIHVNSPIASEAFSFSLYASVRIDVERCYGTAAFTRSGVCGGGQATCCATRAFQGRRKRDTEVIRRVGVEMTDYTCTCNAPVVLCVGAGRGQTSLWRYDAFGPVVLVTPEHHRLLPPNHFPRGSPILTPLLFLTETPIETC
jgi:hypothetical protein